MSTRRAFLRGLAGGAGVLASFGERGIEPILAAGRAAGSRAPEDLASDEDYWREIQQAFTHDEFRGLRVTPNVYTTLQEIDAFAEEMERVAAAGLPS